MDSVDGRYFVRFLTGTEKHLNTAELFLVSTCHSIPASILAVAIVYGLC